MQGKVDYAAKRRNWLLPSHRFFNCCIACNLTLSLRISLISHDVSLVLAALCDQVMVINHGEIVECGSCAQVFPKPH